MANKKLASEKVTYEIDPYNRLIINKAGKESQLSRFRQVLDGRFKTDENNSIRTGFFPISAHVKYWQNKQTASKIAQILSDM